MKRESVNIVLGQIQALYNLGTLGGLSETQLLELFLTRGEDVAQDAFTALVHRHGPMVLGVCRRMLVSTHDAEDAFQATFLILARRAASIVRREQLANWLYGVAVRTARESRRRAARQHARERRLMNVSKVGAEYTPDESHRDLLSLLDEELNRLPPRYRAALVACELEGKSRREAAIQLEMPEGTLSTNLARGRKLLRERLLRRGVSLGVGPFAGLAQPITAITVSERLAGATIRTALSYASGGVAAGTVPATVASLAEAVLKMMLVTRLAVILTSLVAVGLTAFVTWASVQTGPGGPPIVAQAQAAPKTNTPAKAKKAQADETKGGPSRARAHGIVVDEAGEPVAGIEVRANDGVDPQSRGVTNANGAFDFLIQEPGIEGISLLAASADRTRQAIYWYGDDDGKPMSVDEMKQPVRVLLKPAREVVVRVLDRQGKPVTDAVVGFVTARSAIADGRTDADGRWKVRVPADSADWSVFARKAQLGFDYAVANGELDIALAPLPDQVTLTLDGARTIQVKAVDGDGKPIAGVNVGLISTERKGRGRFWDSFFPKAELRPATGKDGVVVLDWLPEHCENMLLASHAEGLYALTDAWIRGDRPVDPLTITFLPLERLSGRVTHADGRPAVDTRVTISGFGPVFHNGPAHSYVSALTDADGRYQFNAQSEQVYVVTANGKEWAAPYRAGIVVHAGKPVDGVDFVLGRATRVHGRVTIGKEARPDPKSSVLVTIDQPLVSDEVRIRGQSYHPRASGGFWAETDENDRYEVYLGPGDYRIAGPYPDKPVTLTIPAANPPAEIIHDIHADAGLTVGPFAGQVVDAANHPVAGAVVNGWIPPSVGAKPFPEQKTNEQGRFQTERSHTPLVLHAQSADGRLTGLARIDAEALDGRVVVGPVTTARGRLLDLDGKALGQKYLRYGIRIHHDKTDDSRFLDAFGGTVQTDAQGRFTVPDLFPGQTYQVTWETNGGIDKGVTTVTPTGPGPIDLGELRVDTVPDRPFHVPTSSRAPLAAPTIDSHRVEERP
jgi:RNA polymerase sigma factor (sigma-70 family)